MLFKGGSSFKLMYGHSFVKNSGNVKMDIIELVDSTYVTSYLNNVTIGLYEVTKPKVFCSFQEQG